MLLENYPQVSEFACHTVSFYTRCRFLVKQQVPSQSNNPYYLFPLPAAPSIPPPPISPACLPTPYSPTTSPLSATEKFTPPPIPPRRSHTYEILEQTRSNTPECQKLDSEHHCYEIMESPGTSCEATRRVHDYQILESGRCSYSKQSYARVNKKK